MQGIKRPNAEISSMFSAAKRMARRYGQIGLEGPDDVCQNTMLKLLRRNNDRPPTIGWLYKTVRCAAADAGRAYCRERQFVCSIDDDSFASVCELADERGNVYLNGRLGRGCDEDREFDVMPRLKTVLAKLTAPLRQVLVLHAEGYSYEAIAEMTNAKIGTVRSRLHYARKRAKDLLNDLNLVR